MLVDSKPVRRVGEFRLKDEELVGAWAEVRRSDRDFDFEHSVVLEDVMSKTRDGSPTKIWRESPAMMCVKAARKGALKVSFPSIFTALAENAQVTVVEQEGMVVDNDTGEILSGETVPEAPAVPEALPAATEQPQSDASAHGQGRDAPAARRRPLSTLKPRKPPTRRP